MKKILVALLALMLLLTGAALAETAQPLALTLTDLTVNTGSVSFTFPMSLEDCKEAGLNVPALDPLEEGSYYYSVPVDNGRVAFNIRVELVKGEMWATGFRLNMKEHSGYSAGGLTVGQTTLGELDAAIGSANNLSDLQARESSRYLHVFGNNIHWEIFFTSAEPDALLEEIIVNTNVPASFGYEFSDRVGVQETDLPDVKNMPFNSFILDGKLYQKGDTMQKLLDNGWVLPGSTTADDEVQAPEGMLIYGENSKLYNGKSFIYVRAFNYTGAVSTVGQCEIEEIYCDMTYGDTQFILADGHTLGATLEALKATFGEPVKEEEGDYGTVYTFSVMNGVDYEVEIVDGAARSLQISDLH